MTRSRIAIFEGYNAPRSSSSGFGRPGGSYGGPIFNNPRIARYGRLGRRGYTVPPLYGPSSYGPVDERGRPGKRLKRRSYKVKKGPNSKAQIRFKKAAKQCSRRRDKGRTSFQACMARKLKRSKR